MLSVITSGRVRERRGDVRGVIPSIITEPKIRDLKNLTILNEEYSVIECEVGSDEDKNYWNNLPF